MFLFQPITLGALGVTGDALFFLPSSFRISGGGRLWRRAVISYTTCRKEGVSPASWRTPAVVSLSCRTFPSVLKGCPSMTSPKSCPRSWPSAWDLVGFLHIQSGTTVACSPGNQPSGPPGFFPNISLMCLLIQGARRGSSCRCGRWRTTRWMCTTWWTSRSPWRMIWKPSVTWAPSWPTRWASSPATSGWASAPLWTRTCPLSLTRQKNTRRTRAAGRLGHCSRWDSLVDVLQFPAESHLF